MLRAVAVAGGILSTAAAAGQLDGIAIAVAIGFCVLAGCWVINADDRTDRVRSLIKEWGRTMGGSRICRHRHRRRQRRRRGRNSGGAASENQAT